MAITVKLADMVEQLELLSDQSAAYLNRRTGEFYLLTEEDLLGLDDEGEEDDADDADLADEPEWLKEAKLKVKEVTTSDDWLALPGTFEIHEYNIMKEFCLSVHDTEMSERLLGQIQGSGAFRRFRDTIDLMGIKEAWYDFRTAALERIAIDWLEENEIAYARDQLPGESIN